MTDPIPPIMTIDQAAEYLGLDSLVLRRLARAGEIPAFKVGRQWRLMKKLVDQWLADEAERGSGRDPE